MVFRLCCCPPSKEVLLLKFHQYLAAHNTTSGIDPEKGNYPDKEYLILCIATLSNGGDEIFDKMYYPPLNQRRRNAPDGTLQQRRRAAQPDPAPSAGRQGRQAPQAELPDP